MRRFNEGVRVLKSLWTEPVTNFEGEFYQLRRTGMWPKPVQQPHVPLWFGGQQPDALRRAVKFADGYTCAGPNTTDEFADYVAQLRRFLGEEGRDPATLPLSKRVYLGIDNDAARAKRRLDEFFGTRYPWQIQRNPNPLPISACGEARRRWPRALRGWPGSAPPRSSQTRCGTSRSSWKPWRPR